MLCHQGGPLSSTAYIIVNLIHENLPPVALFKGLTLSVPERVPAGYFIGQLNATNNDVNATQLTYTFANASYNQFTLNATGALFARQPLNWLLVTNYSFVVVVSDPFNLTDNGTVYVNVLDVPLPPVIFNQTRNVSELVPHNTPVGAPIVATDIDPGMAYVELEFSLLPIGRDYGYFNINPCSGQITVKTDGALVYAQQVRGGSRANSV